MLQSLHYPDTLPKQLFVDSLEFMHSAFAEKVELRAEKNTTLWNLVSNFASRQQKRNDGDAERARYTSTRELAMACVERDRSGLWTTRTTAGMNVWLGWLPAVFNSDYNGILPC